MLSRDQKECIMALRAWASLARLDKLKLIPQDHRPFGCGVSSSLPGRATSRPLDLESHGRMGYGECGVASASRCR